MFVPAHNERLMDSASRSMADVLLLDIEDSVQPVSNKQSARDNIICYIESGSLKVGFYFLELMIGKVESCLKMFIN